MIAEHEAMRNGCNNLVRELKTEMIVLTEREIRMWCQRLRNLWLKHDDSNYTYFHSKATK